MDSPNVQQEVQLAWEARRPILPLLLEAVHPPEAIRYAVAGRQWIEILDRSGLADIADASVADQIRLPAVDGQHTPIAALEMAMA